MDNSWHQTVPNTETELKNLLSTADRQGLLNWLHTLSALPSADVAGALHKALNTLRDNKADTGVLVWLEDFAGYLDNFSRQIERTLLDSVLTLDARQSEVIQTTIDANLALAEFYIQLLDDEVLGQQVAAGNNPSAYFILNALKSAEKVLLMASQAYQPPSPGFWQFCYRLYKRAAANGILTEPVTFADSKVHTIAQVFNGIILLQLADMSQFRSQEMRAIHQVINELRLALAIHPLPISDGRRWYMLDLAAGQPPVLCKAAPAGPSADSYYICSVPAARQLELVLQNTERPVILKTINQGLYIRLIKTLSGQMKRRHTRLAKRTQARAICGFNNIVNYLRQNTAFETITPVTTEAKKLTADNLSLVPEGSESVHQLQWQYRDDESVLGRIVKLGKHEENNVWRSLSVEDQPPSIVQASNVDILDSSVRGFKILWPDTLQAIKVGELIALLQDDGQRLETGLIRRVNRLGSGVAVLGVEMIGFECELARFAKPGINREFNWAIVLPGVQSLQQPDGLVFNTSGFAAGENIVLSLGQINVRGKLTKFVNLTPAVSHAELLYDKQSQAREF